MTFARGIFLFALMMFTVGVVGSKLTARVLLAGPPEPTMQLIPTYTPSPRREARARPRHAVKRTPTARATKPPTATATVAVSPTPTLVPTATAALTPTPLPSPSFTPTALATPSPTAGTVTLARYWVNEMQARPGQTIAIGYVISNDTSKTVNIMLGASVKSSTTATWAAAINDPGHDVVA